MRPVGEGLEAKEDRQVSALQVQGETSVEPTERAAAAEGDSAALYRTGWSVGPHATGQRADGKGRAAAQGRRVSREQSRSGVSCGARVKPLGTGTGGVCGYACRREPARCGPPHGQRRL